MDLELTVEKLNYWPKTTAILNKAGIFTLKTSSTLPRD